MLLAPSHTGRYFQKMTTKAEIRCVLGLLFGRPGAAGARRDRITGCAAVRDVSAARTGIL